MMYVKYYPPGELGTKVSKQKYIKFLKSIYQDMAYKQPSNLVFNDTVLLAQSLWKFNRLSDIYNFVNVIKLDLPLLEYEVERLEQQYPEYSF